MVPATSCDRQADPRLPDRRDGGRLDERVLGVYHMGRISAATESLYEHEMRTLKAAQAAKLHLLYASRAQMGLLSALHEGGAQCRHGRAEERGQPSSRSGWPRSRPCCGIPPKAWRSMTRYEALLPHAEEAHGRVHRADEQAIARQLAVRWPRVRGQRAVAEGFPRGRGRAGADGGPQRQPGQGQHGPRATRPTGPRAC